MAKIGLGDVRLRVGHCALDATLGGYYQDMRPALALVEGGFHGVLDEDGVPKFNLRGQWHYNVTTIAQYALALHDLDREAPDAGTKQKLRIQLQALESRIETEGARRGFAINDWDNSKYPQLKAPWVSAMYQGNMVSALLRGWQLFGEERWRAAAQLALEAMDTPLGQGGACIQNGTDLWLEEYPMTPPSHVLNGFIYALWGVLDWARAFNDEAAWQKWKAGVSTLIKHLPEYDCGYWSVYDLRFRELASRYYQENIHVPQMQAMHALTGEAIFEKYAGRWEAQSQSALCRARWAIGLRVQARLRKKS
jgi:hypothetical protein